MTERMTQDGFVETSGSVQKSVSYLKLKKKRYDNMRNQSFNFDETLKQLQSGKNLLGTDGILTPLIKQLTEAALQAEIEHYLSTTSIDTRKNGYTRKTVKSTSGQFELKTPRDRLGAFEPQLIKKNQKNYQRMLITKSYRYLH